MENIDEPLQNVPFNKFHNNLGNSSNIRKFFLHKTSVQGLLVNMHLFPRTERGAWNKALKKDKDNCIDNDEYIIEGETL